MTREEINKQKQKEIFQEENKEKIKKTIKLIFKLTIILIILTCSFFAYTTYISTTKIGVREYRVIEKKLPDSFNGLKIIQISDLHYGSTMFNKDVKKLVKLVNDRKPDLILFTGDLINKNYKLSSKEQEALIEELKKMNSSLGKYAINGEEDSDSFLTILNQSDFAILNNESELIFNNNNEPILLVGLSSYLANKQDIEKAFSYFKEATHNSNIYTITILHEPDAVEDIKEVYPTDLYLAGHSHNGSIRIPYFNYALKKDGAKTYDQDYYNINGSKLYISSGLGTNNSNSIRLFCRPSINFFRLSNK